MKKITKDGDLGECIETHCKAKSERLNFCNEHFEHFKFGVIKRDGSHPTDHEKKSNHFKRFKDRNVTG